MSTTTTRLTLLKPIGTEAVNQITQFNNNFDTTDLNMGARVCTSATRPGSPYQGLLIFETDTGLLRIWTGAAWKTLSRTADQAWVKIQAGEITGGTNYDFDPLQGGAFQATDFAVHRLRLRGHVDTGPGSLGLRVNGEAGAAAYEYGRIEFDGTVVFSQDLATSRFYGTNAMDATSSMPIIFWIYSTNTFSFMSLACRDNTGLKTTIAVGRAVGTVGPLEQLNLGASAGTLGTDFILEGLMK